MKNLEVKGLTKEQLRQEFSDTKRCEIFTSEIFTDDGEEIELPPRYYTYTEAYVEYLEEKLTIPTNGNVGIGNNSPSDKL